jgi:hypothetical protein
MSEHVTTEAPPPAVPPVPAWLRRRFLDPGEPVAWWQGPKERGWKAWLKDHEGPLFIPVYLSFFVCTLAGMPFGPAGFVLGVGLSLCLIAAFVTVVGNSEKHKWIVITDRRLFVVTGRKKTEEFDLALLRRLLGTLRSPPATPASKHVLDLGKVGTRNEPSQNVTDLASVLAMAKLMQQVQGAGKVTPA